MALYNLDISIPFEPDPDPSNSEAPRASVLNFSRMLRRIAVGEMPGAASVKAATEGVVATGTITLATCLAGTVIEVNGVDFRAIASGTPTIANGEFVISGTDAADATSLVAAINGSTDARIANVLTASSTGATGVVTLTATRSGLASNAVQIKTKGVCASGTVTVVVALTDLTDTVTINGTAMTAIVQRATGTLVAATAVAGTTFVLNGVLFTGKAGAVTLGQPEFSIDTGNTATAVSIAAQINALTDPLVSGVVTATSATDTVTIRAVTAGTAGNAITLEGTATVLEASDTVLAGGIAVANNQFDFSPGSTATQVAADLVRCINASSTALVSSHVTAYNTAGVVTLVAKYSGTPGNHITLASSDADGLGVSGSGRLTGGTELNAGGTPATAVITFASVANADTVTVGGVVFTAHTNTETLATDTFEISGDDTADAASFCKIFNASLSALAFDVRASNSAGVVTLTARRGGVSGNAITIATSNGTRAAITGGASRLTGGVAPTTVALSGSQLASGTATYTTFSF